MSHAEYAHRGAYPLLATAMLAGSFAMAARPFWAEHRLIRPLLLFWLAQNLALCGAAALRLDLYIAAYGQTPPTPAHARWAEEEQRQLSVQRPERFGENVFQRKPMPLEPHEKSDLKCHLR